MRIFSGLSTIAAVLAIAGAAWAHPQVISTSPTAGATSASPGQISVTFSEALSAPLSGLVLKSADGKTVPTRAAKPKPANTKQMVATVASPLAPGVYEVDWHAVAADTHRATGKFSFTVR